VRTIWMRLAGDEEIVGSLDPFASLVRYSFCSVRSRVALMNKSGMGTLPLHKKSVHPELL
jgi:hypothetical protein